jgi:mevalonate kinase
LPGSGANVAGLFSPSSQHHDLVSTSEQAVIILLPHPPQLSLCYCGYKTPTGDVLAGIAKRMQGREAAYAALYGRMGGRAMAAITAARLRDWPVFAEQLNAYQDLMVELRVSDPMLDALVARARSEAGVMAAKISGSGLGDCILALGPLVAQHQPAPFTAKGLVLDD